MSEFSFEKRSIVILVFSMIMLLILVYILGLLTGLAMERSAPESKNQLKAVEVAEPKSEDEKAPEIAQGNTAKSGLSQETELKPVTPEFKEVSPQAEQPKISQPKKE